MVGGERNAAESDRNRQREELASDSAGLKQRTPPRAGSQLSGRRGSQSSVQSEVNLQSLQKKVTSGAKKAYYGKVYSKNRRSGVTTRAYDDDDSECNPAV